MKKKNNEVRPNNIEKLRQTKGWTMQQLADKMDTQRAQVNKLEKGHIQLKEFWLLKLSKALECDISDILSTDFFRPVKKHERSLSQICLKFEQLNEDLKFYLRKSTQEEAMLSLFRALTKEQQESLISLARGLVSKK